MHYGLSIGIIRGSQSLVITVKIIVSLAISKMIILFHFSPSMVTGVSALARHTGQDESIATSHLFQRYSLNLMRGNAAMMTTRIPDDDFPQAQIDGVA